MTLIKYMTACVSAVVLWMFFKAGRTNVVQEELTVPSLPDPFEGKSIFFISDIHRRRIPVSLIRKVRGADLVIIGGDLLEKGVPYPRIRLNIRRLKQIGPVLFVWGNNDIEKNTGQLQRLFEEEGVVVLENSIYSWDAGGRVVPIAGAGSNTLSVDRFMLQSIPKTGPLLFVLHDPADLQYIEGRNRIDAALSGHTHGGQIRIGKLSPGEPGGWKDRYGFPLLISNGFGTTKLPLRLGAPVETHLIKLRSRT
ncbi:metallophosphoesterase [Salibacterium halotolerans]|uniref:Predicted phosphohydrolase, MPP superfamily n=1 Tax=Salibacterium halotolerans TaxID=1884432 RepID=A0A1I5Q2M2_9BACI|nr:metallophosphoesterase [Salibacterium halotolerans]SFP40447.1 Predicted phosphohydrolase, MPP superfamily [Salibacterium halotolerans]